MTVISQAAEVVAVDSMSVRLSACEKKGCASCHLAGGCGQGLWARWLTSSSTTTFELPHPGFELHPGDRVELVVLPTDMMKAALLQFLLPLLGLLLGALMAEQAGMASLLWTALSGLLGLVLGLLLARRWAGRRRPQLVRKLAANEIT